MTINFKFLLLCALIVSTIAVSHPKQADAAIQATYYASTSGSGSTCSLALPCSLSGAQAKVRTVNASMTGDIYVYLRGGTYTLSSSMTFNATDSGTNGYYVYYKNYTGETPIISGGTDLTGGWAVHDAIKNIYSKSVGALEFRQLYSGNAHAIRARAPNRTSNDNLGPYYRTAGADIVNKTLKVNKAEIAAWANLTQVEMVTQPHWYHNHLRISSYTTDATYAYIDFQASEEAYAFMKDAAFYTANAYHFENAYELLDAEGEWYLNTVTDTLYYKPRAGENMTTLSIVAPNTEILFDMAGTSVANIHHIEFAGLTFKHSEWNSPSVIGLVATQGVHQIPTDSLIENTNNPPGAVKATYANNLRFVNNSFTFMGANGLQFYKGVSSSQIIGNTFSYIAANAINLDAVSKRDPAASDQTHSNLVANNTISRVGQVYTNGIGILASFVKDTIIENNDISYGPYMGIQIGNQAITHIEAGMGGNKIRYNHIHHMMQLHDDGGGIYTLARQLGTHVYQNYVHDIVKSTWAMNYPVAALYADNFSEYVTFEHNVVSGNTANTNENSGGGARYNNWINNGTSDAAVISNAGVKVGYVEPVSTMLAFEKMNAMTTGSAPTGWTNITTGGTVTVEGVPSATDKSIKLTKSGSPNDALTSKTFTAHTGKLSIDANLRVSDVTTWKNALYVADSGVNTAISLTIANGYLNIYNGSTTTQVQAVAANTWYYLKLLVNPATDQFDLYVNGVLKSSNVAFRTATANIGKLTFGIGSSSTGTMYVDNVAVYKY